MYTDYSVPDEGIQSLAKHDPSQVRASTFQPVELLENNPTTIYKRYDFLDDDLNETYVNPLDCGAVKISLPDGAVVSLKSTIPMEKDLLATLVVQAVFTAPATVQGAEAQNIRVHVLSS